MTLERASIAANRFGLGARPGELGRIAADPAHWLLAQLTPERALPAALAQLPSAAESLAAFYRFRGALKASKDGTDMQAQDGAGASVEGMFKEALGPLYLTGAKARFDVAVASDRPFFERWVRFWSNHFCVSAVKPQVVTLAAPFERDVARAHALGRFEDMLLASAHHPGMLLYLDNATSIGPNSLLASRPQFILQEIRPMMRGRNENLARETLELHTLGVRTGYDQSDVIALANMLTGWTVNRRGIATGGAPFRFLAPAHEPGAQTLLGKRFDQPGEAQAEAALHMLAGHPATARHIALKVARHFVADTPPAPLVARLERSFVETRGDLAALAATLVHSPESWAPAAAKLRPPEDYVIATVRALGGPALEGRQIVGLLTRMGQRPLAPSGPDGFADIEGEWIGADPLWKRLEWVTAAATRMASATADPASIGNAVLGPWLHAETLAAVRAADSPAQGLALLLASPEFQRR
jgi:uncharacterized protein (DUF1800 family)